MTFVQQPTSADLGAIRDVLNQLVAAWNQADGSAYGALFTDDADYIDVDRTPHARRHRNRADAPAFV